MKVGFLLSILLLATVFLLSGCTQNNQISGNVEEETSMAILSSNNLFINSVKWEWSEEIDENLKNSFDRSCEICKIEGVGCEQQPLLEITCDIPNYRVGSVNPDYLLCEVFVDNTRQDFFVDGSPGYLEGGVPYQKCHHGSMDGYIGFANPSIDQKIEVCCYLWNHGNEPDKSNYVCKIYELSKEC